MNSADERGVTGGPRHRKRIVTNARKEQNRIAQKLYRQRQRERVQNRQSYRHDLSGEHRRQLRPRQSRGTLPEASESMTLGAVGAATAEAQTRSNRDTLFYENALQPDFLLPLDRGGMTTHGLIPGDEFNSDDILSLPMDCPPLLGMDPSMLINTPGYGSRLFQAPSMAVNANEAGSVSGLPASNFLDAPVSTNQVPLAMFDSSTWPGSMDATPLTWYNSQHGLSREQPMNTLLCLSNPAENSSCYLQSYTSNILNDPGDLAHSLMDAPINHIPEFEEVISATYKFIYGRRVPTSSAPSLPDPYINALQCSLTATLQVYMHNAHCIGLELQDLINHRSPFYRPNTTIADDPQALLAAAHRHWIPIHLQPTLPQILIPHHPYLDLLPLPALRARAITLAAAAPPLFQHLELKKDIFRDGLYWNRYGGKQPWDIGSWKAAPWFLRKWRLLID